MLLQNPQQFHLKLIADAVDFVEKDGATVGRFETPRTIFNGAGKSPFSMTEQLTFKQTL
jgi:hypothetical protein